MVAVATGLLLLIGGGWLLYRLGLLARERGRSPSWWIMLVMTAWAFCWVLEKYGVRLWLGQEVPPPDFATRYMWIVAATLLACLLIYALVYLWLHHLPARSRWEQQLDRIGRDE